MLVMQEDRFSFQLKSFAMVAQRNDDQVKELANPAYKGYTLSSLAVEPYTNEVLYDKNLQVGMIIFIIVYLLSIIFIIYLLLFLTPSMLKEYVHKFNEDEILESPHQVQLVVLFLLALFYIPVIIGTDIFQLALNPNVFAIVKLVLSLFIIIMCFVYCGCCGCCCPSYNNSECNYPCWRFFLVATLLSFTFLLSLDMIPTILLLFIFPVESFALIMIHVALLYAETMAGTLIVHYFRRQINESCDCECTCKMFGLTFCSVFTSMLMICAYFSIVFFFQLLILRNVNDNEVFSLIISYLPSVIIIVFGTILRKGIFPTEKKSENLSCSVIRPNIQLGALP